MISRRGFLKRSGVIVATFALGLPTGGAPVSAAAPPVSFAKNGKLEGWIAVNDEGAVTVFTGKVELGQGMRTALGQIAAEERDVGLDQIGIVSASTVRGPDEGYTFGSQSVEQGGSALRAASAFARGPVVAAAAKRFGIDPAALTVERGVVKAPDGRRLGYGEIVRDDRKILVREVQHLASPKRPEQYRIVGKPAPRLDLPDKVMARGVFLQDMRLPGMVFGRVVRPPHAGAELLSLDETAAGSVPGVLAVVRLRSLLGVVAEREEQAIRAAGALRKDARWKPVDARLPDDARLPQELERLAREDVVVKDSGRAPGKDEVARWVEATYSRPYLSHASMGPSCAVAKVERGKVTVWSHTQGPFPLRGDLATALGLPSDYVQVIHVQAAGCYGHNGADDAALDAALLAMAVPGRPVKLQWSRHDEFVWSPAGPAMLMRAKAGLSPEGKVVDWDYALWSNSHASRPGQPGGLNLLGAWYLGNGHHISPPLKIPQPFGNGDRNAVPLYDFPRQRIVNHLLTEMPVRTSSLRTLGSHGNVFAVECFMDELAAAAGIDPVAFRLTHLTDPRARPALQAAADAAGWTRSYPSDRRRGSGVAYTRYKNISTYVAVVVEIDVDRV